MEALVLALCLYHQSGAVRLSLSGSEGSAFFLKNLPGDRHSPEYSDVSVLTQQNLFTLNPSRDLVVEAEIPNLLVRQTLHAWNESDLDILTAGITVHLVNTVVTDEQPLLRVLVHSDILASPPPVGSLSCVEVFASFKLESVSSRCLPLASDGHACLVPIIMPLQWWPVYGNDTRIPLKKKPILVSVTYTVHKVDTVDQCQSNLILSNPSSVDPNKPHMGILVGTVELESKTHFSKLMSVDEMIKLLMPDSTVFHPGSVFSIPIRLHYSAEEYQTPLYLIQLRCRVRQGLKILGAVDQQASLFTIRTDMNSIQRTITTTSIVKNSMTLNETFFGEVFRILFLVTSLPDGGKRKRMSVEERNVNDSDAKDSPAITILNWSVRYVVDTGKLGGSSAMDNQEHKRLSNYVELTTDAVEAVIAVSKHNELLNTAVLSLQPVSSPMKVFSVSFGGVINDVTLQSSCTSNDVKVLKVTASCTSVYVDGSETRGSANATIRVTFGEQMPSATAHFTVWYPEFPIEVWLSDPQLSSIKGWRTAAHSNNPSNVQAGRRSRREVTFEDETVDAKTSHCRQLFQHSRIQVYARFIVWDMVTGRRDYLSGMGRSAKLDVTTIAVPWLTVSDNSVVTLDIKDVRRPLLRGVSPGRSEVRVARPLSGKEVPYGASEVEVTTEKVIVTKFISTAVSGLSVKIQPHPTQIQNLFMVMVLADSVFSHRYQEGTLVQRLEFSDGTTANLQDFSSRDYQLETQSLAEQAVYVGSSPSSHESSPKLLSIGVGSGNFIDVSLRLPSECGRPSAPPIISTRAHVENQWAASTSRETSEELFSLTTLANFSTIARLLPSRDLVIPVTLFSGKTEPQQDTVPLSLLTPTGQSHLGYRSSIDTTPSTQKRKGTKEESEKNLLTQPGKVQPNSGRKPTTIEIVMYALLGVFCLAVVVFMLNCLFGQRQYLKLKPLSSYLRIPSFVVSRRESVAAAQDWVWVGRDALERASINTRCSQTLVPEEDFVNNNGLSETSFGSFDDTVSHLSTLRTDGGHLSIQRHPNPNRISYQGSEISIHITPNPCLEIHPGASSFRHGATKPVGYASYSAVRPTVSQVVRPIRASSWNNRPRVRITPNPIADSSSEQNLSSYCCSNSPTHQPQVSAYSANDVQWDSSSLGMTEYQLRTYFNSLRESTA